MKKIIIIAIIVFIVSGSYFGWKIYNKSQQTLYEFVLAKNGSIVSKATATGNVKTAQEINLAFKTSGRVKEIFVKPSDQVKAEQEIIKLETNELDAQLKESQANLALAEAKLNQVIAGASTEEIKLAQTAVENAQRNLEHAKISTQEDINKVQVSYNNTLQDLNDTKTKAEIDLEQDYKNTLTTLGDAFTKIDNAISIYKNMRESYFNGSGQTDFIIQNNEEEIKNLFLGNPSFNKKGSKDYYEIAKNDPSHENIEKALDEMEITADKMKSILDYMRSAMNDTSVSSTDKTSIETERTNIDKTLNNLTTAEQNIESQKITNQQSINTAQAALDLAQQTLNTTKANAQKEINQLEGALKTAQDELAIKRAPARQADIQIVQAGVSQAQAAAEQAKIALENATIKAPIDGIITSIDAEIGETAQTNQTVARMMGLSKYEIEVDVSETDIAQIKINNPVEITLDAFPYHEPWDGSVIKIDPAQTIIQGVVYYKVTINFVQLDERIKPGMTANITIIADRKENVLLIPQKALINKDGQTLVRVINNGNKNEYKEILIKVGLWGSNGEVEIIEGLKDGDKVITYINK